MSMLFKVTWNQAAPLDAPYLWEHHEAVFIAGSKEGAIARINKKYHGEKRELKASIVPGIYHRID